MRGTRKNRRHHKGKDKLVTTVTFFIIAPILGIVIGVFLVNYIVLPRLPGGDMQPTGQPNAISDQNEEPTPEQDTTETVSKSTETSDQSQPSYGAKLQDVQLYSVQVGSFSEVENARAFLNELKEKGISGYILKSDDYKVFAGAFLTREDGEAYKDMIKETYGDSFINEKVVRGRKLSYKKEEYEAMKGLGKAIDGLHTAYEDESRMWKDVLNTQNFEGLKSKINLNNKTIEAHMDVLDGLQVNEEILSLKAGLNKQLEARQGLAETLNEQKLLDNYETFNEMLLAFVNLIKVED